ncbi:MAG: Lsr2 family protein [Jiangellaceae bacterium]|nr:Lsr2 family protein [Jiangellaceae bacterium]
MTGVREFVVAKNPEPESRLPYLIAVPYRTGLVFRAGDTWPRTKAVYCHPLAEWPVGAHVVERVPVRSVVRRGAAIDLVLDRARENRSQLVFTTARGREVVFWQSARTRKQARPGIRTPSARAAGLAELLIIVDSHERYGYRFADQQVTTTRRALPAGDYAIERDGRLVAVVERKSLADLVSSLTTGRLRFTMGELAALPRAAIVVEDRYSQVFKLEQVRPAVVADGLAELQVRYLSVPIVFCETRPLAEEWTYRFLAAAYSADVERTDTAARLATVEAPPTTGEIRAWAISRGLAVAHRGRLSAEVVSAYHAAHAT